MDGVFYTVLMNVFLLKPSWIYRIYSVLVHVFAVLCIASVVSFYTCLMGLIVMTGSFLFYFYRKESIVILECTDQKEWIVHRANAEIARAEILSSSVMMSWFLILHFEVLNDKQKKRCIVFRDSLSREDFYALRRCVRCAFL